MDTKIICICYSLFSLFFSIPLPWRVFHLIYPPLDHLHPTLVDHPSPYLSTCSIRHPLWFSVSCGSQGSTIQRSSPHKCGQKSSCNAFNAVVAAFLYIFLGFLLSRMFMRLVPVIGASWRVTLIAGVHTWAAFIISEEEFLLGPPSIRFLLMRL